MASWSGTVISDLLHMLLIRIIDLCLPCNNKCLRYAILPTLSQPSCYVGLALGEGSSEIIDLKLMNEKNSLACCEPIF